MFLCQEIMKQRQVNRQLLCLSLCKYFTLIFEVISINHTLVLSSVFDVNVYRKIAWTVSEWHLWYKRRQIKFPSLVVYVKTRNRISNSLIGYCIRWLICLLPVLWWHSLCALDCFLCDLRLLAQSTHILSIYFHVTFMSESLIEVIEEGPVLWFLCKIFMILFLTLFLIQVILRFLCKILDSSHLLHFCLQSIFPILLSVLCKWCYLMYSRESK